MDTMDSSNYKDTQTCRGLKYHYYFSPAQASKPTILFIHGFPSTSRDWTKQVAHFQPLGYGIVVPDLLGYGGTDKPRNHEAYRASLMTRDVIDILDAEGLKQVVVISHDWCVLSSAVGCRPSHHEFIIHRGTWFTSRLMNFFPERFHGTAFLASGYMAPLAWDYEKMNADSKRELGYDVMGYHSFMASEGADKLMEDHVCCPTSSRYKVLRANLFELSLPHFLEFCFRTIPTCGRQTLHPPVGSRRLCSKTSSFLGHHTLPKRLVCFCNTLLRECL